MLKAKEHLMDFLTVQEKYWNTLGEKIESDIACAHHVKDDNTPMEVDVFQEIAAFIKDSGIKNLTSGRILEIGCGNGLILRELSKILGEKWMLSGSDISENLLRRTLAPQATMYCADARNTPAGANEYDLIYLHSVLQYFDNEEYLRDVITDCMRIIKPGGSLYFLDVPITWYREMMADLNRPKSLFIELKKVLKRKLPFLLNIKS